MPLRSQVLSKRWSTVDLPILPFLAPRAFQPWPWPDQQPPQSRRPFSKRQRTQSTQDVHRKASEASASEFYRDAGVARTYTVSRAAGSSHHLSWRPRNSITRTYLGRRPAKTFFENLRNLHRSIHHCSCYSTQCISDPATKWAAEEEFRKRYRETWGTAPPVFKDDPPLFKDDSPVINNDLPLFKEELPIFADGRGEIPQDPFTPTLLFEPETPLQNESKGFDIRSETRLAIIGEVSKRSSLRLRLRAHDQHEVKRLRIPSARAKFARYVIDRGFRFLSPSIYWHRRFAIINLRHQHFMRGRKNRRLIAVHNFRLPALIVKQLASDTTNTSLATTWKDLTYTSRLKLFPNVMLKTLVRYPAKALDVLSILYTNPYPPSFAVGDTLDYIVSFNLWDKEKRRPKLALQIWQKIDDIMFQGPHKYIHLSQNSIFLLLKHLDDLEAEALWDTLEKYNHPLTFDTLIHFATRFAKLGRKKQALEIVKRLGVEGCIFDSQRMESLCTTVLKNSPTTLNEVADSDIVRVFLVYGMKPNIVTYNVLLGNAVMAGDRSTAWQLHDMIVEMGVDADAYTYSWLLNDAKLNYDVPTIERVAGYVRDAKIRNVHIATDLIHAIFLLRQRAAHDCTSRSEFERQLKSLFGAMFEVYRENFRVEPLMKLIPRVAEPLLDHSSSLSDSADMGELMEPHPATLVVMLTGYLRGITNSREALDFYDHFRKMVLSGDPAVSGLVKTTRIYCAILLCFGRFPERLPDCPNVIADMLPPSTGTISTSNDEESRNEDAESEEFNEAATAKAGDGMNVPDVYAARNPSDQEIWMSAAHSTEESSSSLDSSQNYFAQRPTPSSPCASLTPKNGSDRPAQANSGPHKPPQPDVYVWSIILNIFISHKQGRAAEKILSMMTDRGILPNQVTWNTLCIGYARMQDPTMTVDTISRLEAAGYQKDAIVLHGLDLLHDKREVIKRLRRMENESLLKKPPMKDRTLLSRMVKAFWGKGAGVKKESSVDVDRHRGEDDDDHGSSEWMYESSREQALEAGNWAGQKRFEKYAYHPGPWPEVRQDEILEGTTEPSTCQDLVPYRP